MLNKREINQATKWSLSEEKELLKRARRVVKQAARDSIIRAARRRHPLTWHAARQHLDSRSEAIFHIAEVVIGEDKLQAERLFLEEVMRAEEVPSSVS
jgi:hypothetical protein